MILDGDGTLVWSKHFANKFGGQAYDLKVQKYKGEGYLTFWLGDDTVRGHGAGHYYMLDSSYDIVHEISAANEMYADLHEFIITPEDTALIIIFEPKLADVRPLGRKFNDLWNQAIWDCVFQELDIATGELLFEWRASEHINITHTYNKLDAWSSVGTRDDPFDPFHLNSVAKDEFGNYLVSARNPHAIYYIDGKTKGVIWTLGGKGNGFQDLSGGHALNFAWQHDARFVSLDAFPETYKAPLVGQDVTVQLLMLFDNAAMDWNYLYGPPYSRALLLELIYPSADSVRGTLVIYPQGGGVNERRFEAVHRLLSESDQEKIGSINGTDAAYSMRVVREFINPKHVRSGTQGSVQLLPQEQGQDPRVFVGYGINAVFTEFGSTGTVLCDIHFGAESSWGRGDVQSYRAYKLPWIGRPRDPPAAKIRGGKVYVSWNGATECREWRIQAADHIDSSEWTDVAQAPKEGFETNISLSTSEGRILQRYVRVLAICQDGKICENGEIVDRTWDDKARQSVANADLHKRTFTRYAGSDTKYMGLPRTSKKQVAVKQLAHFIRAPKKRHSLLVFCGHVPTDLSTAGTKPLLQENGVLRVYDGR
ncbi:hypothetical protein LTR37_004603 [Vermiconidia calcicola]|uniref:Uncharacterized protein n=1 Tax=Vermiconidia calcicola TaxID=1690605 RepID=A0ACC3NL96_9PEZI|nr:hypothetical protein LTR37_004603 [Vermiconidia calcicola]